MERIRKDIEREENRKPLWKNRGLPARGKIPLEAATVALLFLIVHATQSQASLPAMPAQPLGTATERTGPAALPAEKTKENAPARMFAAPPSRLLRPVPYGREVTIEVTREHRAGLEERIAAAALRLGGTVARELSRPGASENGALPDQVRVHVPSDSAETFLAELSQLGTLPLEGMPGWTDLPAGPSPGVVAYAVRIRVR